MPPRNHRENSQRAKSINAPFDPASTVRLPPPAASGAYAWTGPGMKPRLSENINQLRTPESIVRMNESGPLKRGMTAVNTGSNKRPKVSHDANLHNELEYHSSLYSQEPLGRQDSPHWNAGFPDRSLQPFDRELERPNTAHPGTYPRQYSSHITPSHFQPSSSMLSPSTTPLNRKDSKFNYATTPTRSIRMSNSAGEPSHYSFVPFSDTPQMLCMPLMPASASAYPGAPMNTPISQGIESRQQFSNVDRSYPQDLGSPKEIEIPPPDEMPEIEDDGKKPIYSYAMLIGMAILRAPERKLTLSQIYGWIMNTFEYYRTSKPTWHNSIRHNLSLNKAFEKKVRPKSDPGKGNYWTIVKDFEYQFLRPRSPKRGPDNSMTSSSSSSSEAPHTSTAPNSSSLTWTSEANSMSGDQVRHPLIEVQPNAHGPHRAENPPSDGTEPDDCLPEDEHSVDLGYMGPSDSRYSSQTDFRTGHKLSPSSNFDLPQMRTMSSSSLSRPHSPAVSSRTDFSVQENSNQGNSSTTSLESTSTKSRSRHPGLEESSEWRGQGQFAFRCSTPSLIRPYQEVNDTTGISNIFTDRHAKPVSYGSFVPAENSVPIQPSRAQAKNKAKNARVRVKSAPYSSKDDGPAILEPELNLPRTPEKAPIDTRGFAPNQLYKASTSLCSNVSLAPPKSFESPYAGTLDLSPGSAFLFDMHGTERNQQPSQALQMHRRKVPSPHHLTDFLELDLRKSEFSMGHQRTASNSSDETNSNPLEHGHSSSALGSAAGSAGSASFWNSFSMSLDADISPRLVMTPIRRPFDTPIRDQSHTYSPYCHGASSSFGSPLRKT